MSHQLLGLAGRVVTHVSGVPVETRDDVAKAMEGRSSVELSLVRDDSPPPVHYMEKDGGELMGEDSDEIFVELERVPGDDRVPWGVVHDTLRAFAGMVLSRICDVAVGSPGDVARQLHGRRSAMLHFRRHVAAATSSSATPVELWVPLGLLLDRVHMELLHCTAGSPAKAAASGCVGMVLAAVCGSTVLCVGDVAAAAEGRTDVELRFVPAWRNRRHAAGEEGGKGPKEDDSRGRVPEKTGASFKVRAAEQRPSGGRRVQELISKGSSQKQAQKD
eukprot:gene16104-1974_t